MYRRQIHINWYMLISSLTGLFVSLFAHNVMPVLGVDTTNLFFENTANIVFLILVAAVPSVIYFTRDRNFAEFKENAFAPIKIWHVFMYIGIAIVLWCACTVLNSVINSWLYKTGFEQVQQLERTKDMPALIAGFISTCVVAPVTEEFFYRGVLLSGISNKGKAVAVILTSFLFALAHGSLTIFAMPFIYGIVFALIAIKTKSIFPSIIMHSVCNILSWIILNAELFNVNMELMGYIVMSAGIAGSAVMMFLAVRGIEKRINRIPEILIKTFVSFTDNIAWIFVIVIYIIDNLMIHGGLYG